MSTFLLEIITPEKVVFNDQVEMVSVPSSQGTLGILPGHVPLFSQLTQGELKIIKQGEETFLSLGGGFVEVTPHKVMILVTKAIHAEEIDESKVLKAKEEAQQALSKKPKEAEFLSAQAVLREALFDLKILKRRRLPPKTLPTS
jgi:F-type H+-transporting ATPase subunit epsilon